MADNILSKVAIVFSGETANLKKDIGKAEGYLNGFTSSVGKIAGVVAGAFAIKEVTAFGFEVAKLSGEADGVRKAFEKLPDSARLMNDLKNATAGTVSELDLMKRTVQAANFGIALESLPSLLEFAAVRAQQTGQSVDYLVDSIVTGIGRKSPLILDNLGISAVALKEKMDGVSIATADVGQVAEAVGKIAAENLKTMGSLAENTSTQTQRLSATWENFKVTLGDVINNTGILQKGIEGLTTALQFFKDAQDDSRAGDFSLLAAGVKSGDDKALVQVVRRYQLLRNEVDKPFNEANVQNIIKKYELSADQSDRFLKLVREINGEIAKTPVPKEPIPAIVPPDTLASLQEKLKGLNDEFEALNITNTEGLRIKGREILALGKQIEELERLRKAQNEALLAPNSIEFYQAQIKSLNEELEKVNVTDTARIRVLSAQISGYEQAIQKVDGLKKSLQGLNEISIRPPDTSKLLDPLTKLRTIQVAEGVQLDVNISLSEQSKQRFEKSLEDFQRGFSQKYAKIKETVQSVDIGGIISGQISGLAEAFGAAQQGVGRFGDAVLKAMTSFAKQMGEILVAAGVGGLALKNLAKNPVLAIAAGAALIALAGAANAAISKKAESTIGSGATQATRLTGTDARGENQLTLTGELTTRVRGQDILIVLERAQASSSRG